MNVAERVGTTTITSGYAATETAHIGQDSGTGMIIVRNGRERMKAINYTRNRRPKRISIKDIQRGESMMRGMKVGVLAMAWIIADCYEIEKEELYNMVKESLEFIIEIGEDKKDPVMVNETLEQMTGINILVEQ